MQVTEDALNVMNEYSAGFPRVMHTIGDWAFWTDRDGTIDEHDALMAVIAAAEDIGKKYVDQQIYDALRSADYQSILEKIGATGPILEKIGATGPIMTFRKTAIRALLAETERSKFDNFLHRMTSLKVLRSDRRGNYEFTDRIVRLYIWLKSIGLTHPQSKTERSTLNALSRSQKNEG